jgi:DNA-binding response OmpR family regulator
MKKILIVDDDTELRNNILEVLTDAGYQADGAASAKEAVAKIEANPFDVILLDYMMPRMNGIEALQAIRRLRPKAKVIMLTAFATIENAVEAIKKGASDYIPKPFKIDYLLTTIRRLLEEAKFEGSMMKLDFDQTLNALANPIRRNIIALLHEEENMRLMAITRKLGVDDHTKVVFHLKILKEAGIIEQGDEKSYSLTQEGLRAIEYLRKLEQYLKS